MQPREVNQPEHFGFAFAPAYRVLARAFGITPESAWVDVGSGALEARFGVPLLDFTAPEESRIRNVRDLVTFVRARLDGKATR